MESKTLLPHLKGADLSHNDFEGERFPDRLNEMKNLEWLRLNKTKLNLVPEEFKQLKALERLYMSHNNLASLHGELILLSELKFLSCRHNRIEESNIPVELFENDNLTVLDLSHNNITVPSNLISSNLKSCLVKLTVLNLSHNNIRNISDQFFVHLTSLKHLDLSDNQLQNVPQQLGRLVNLKTLILNNNPLKESKMRQFKTLRSLENLQLANTHRYSCRHKNVDNLPPLSELDNLVELNLSSNQLDCKVVDSILIKSLRRLNLSDNNIEKFNGNFDFEACWPNLRVLNISSNRLAQIPASLCKLRNLKRIYMNDNQLTFDGLPKALGKLHQLEVFMAAGNLLENIPESITRCGRLKKLILSRNNLLTLPDTIHLLLDLETLELSNNPNLKMPPKMPITDPTRNPEFYNVDFTLETQRIIAGNTTKQTIIPPKPPAFSKLERIKRLQACADVDIDDDAVAVKKGTKHNKDLDNDLSNQAKVLKGMKDLLTDKDLLEQRNYLTDMTELDLKPKRWDENLERPPIDYSEFFDETTGKLQGLTIWEIDNFYPVLLDVNLYGKFYTEDCYIVLSTQIGQNLHSLDWKIFYWIGLGSSLDKSGCSAIHAVGLRNHLKARCRTIREEQGDESDEFLALFPEGIDYVQGARTKSGFYPVDETNYTKTAYRLHEIAEISRRLHLQTVEYLESSFDSRFVFLIDAGLKIFIWNGCKAKNTIKQRARLIGEKLNNEERKNKAELVFCDQGNEPQEFLDEFDLDSTLPKTPIICEDLGPNFNVDAFQPARPVLYNPKITLDFEMKPIVQLEQVHFKTNQLKAKLLNPSKVYIFDCQTCIFVWAGRKSSKTDRVGSLRIAEDLFKMIHRPKFASVWYCSQGNEPLYFKTKFCDWDTVVAVDYTRTAESVSKTGPDLVQWASKRFAKTDLISLFSPRPHAPTLEDARLLIKNWNEELKFTGMFMASNRKPFNKLHDSEFGHFYSGESYVFLYSRPMIEPGDDDDYYIEGSHVVNGARMLAGQLPHDGDHINPAHSQQQQQQLPNGIDSNKLNGINGVGDNHQHGQINNNSNFMNDLNNGNDGQVNSEFVLYFWQGRNASQMSWLNFTFSIQKEFETMSGNKLEVIKLHQQQESPRFLAHFKQKFIIHQGKRPSGKTLNRQLANKPIQLYHLRSNGDPLTLRCIEIEPVNSTQLNSGFCYILQVNKTSSAITSNHHSEDNHITNGFTESDILNASTEVASVSSSEIFIWIGSNADPNEASIAEEIASEKLAMGFKNCQVNLVAEGCEPDSFWLYMGGKREYDLDSSYMSQLRLFRCSNDRGYFCISEERLDFCQDDLSDDDIMILDNGTNVIIWIGPKSSEAELRLAYRSAQVYVENLGATNNTRQLLLTYKGKETKKFTKCFHAWGKHKEVKDPRGDEARFLKFH